MTSSMCSVGPKLEEKNYNTLSSHTSALLIQNKVMEKIALPVAFIRGNEMTQTK